MVNYWEHCPDVLNGGKRECKDDGDDCACYMESETGCQLGICVCLLDGHLAFNEIKCVDANHPKILGNTSHHDLSCPRTCLASSPSNWCPPTAIQKDDGRCYCANDSLAIPRFTSSHRLDTFSVCSHAGPAEFHPFPEVFPTFPVATTTPLLNRYHQQTLEESPVGI